MFSIFRKDLQRYFALLCDEHRLKACILVCITPGVHATFVLRLSQFCYSKGFLLKLLTTPFCFLLRRGVIVLWGIDIPSQAQVGPGLHISHYGGIFVSPYAVLGSNLNLSQDVTIGISGQGNRRGAPVIGNDVYIAPGAKIFGKIKIGSNVKIGANAVIHKDVPDDAVAALVPGFQILSAGGSASSEPKLPTSPARDL